MAVLLYIAGRSVILFLCTPVSLFSRTGLGPEAPQDHPLLNGLGLVFGGVGVGLGLKITS